MDKDTGNIPVKCMKIRKRKKKSLLAYISLVIDNKVVDIFTFVAVTISVLPAVSAVPISISGRQWGVWVRQVAVAVHVVVSATTSAASVAAIVIRVHLDPFPLLFDLDAEVFLDQLHVIVIDFFLIVGTLAVALLVALLPTFSVPRIRVRIGTGPGLSRLLLLRVILEGITARREITRMVFCL